MSYAHRGVRTSRPRIAGNPEFLRSQFLLLCLTISAFLSAGCPLSDSTLFDTVAGDPQVGRAPADDAGGGDAGVDPSGSQGDSGDDEAMSSFEARLQAEFPDCGDTQQAATWEVRVLELVNLERATAGLRPVVWNQTLAQQATQYACEMIHYDFFDHVNPVTRSTLAVRANQFDYSYLVIGENLAAGQRTPEHAMSDWMDSPGHRQNILDPRFVELGVGVRFGGEFGTYWVQEFGLPGGK